MKYILFILSIVFAACAHKAPEKVPPAEAARLDKNLVRNTVVFEPGAEAGAVLPDISAPRLRATLVPEKIEGNRLIEKHREWTLEGDVILLSIPETRVKSNEDHPIK